MSGGFPRPTLARHVSERCRKAFPTRFRAEPGNSTDVWEPVVLRVDEIPNESSQATQNRIYGEICTIVQEKSDSLFCLSMIIQNSSACHYQMTVFLMALEHQSMQK